MPRILPSNSRSDIGFPGIRDADQGGGFRKATDFRRFHAHMMAKFHRANAAFPSVSSVASLAEALISGCSRIDLLQLLDLLRCLRLGEILGHIFARFLG